MESLCNRYMALNPFDVLNATLEQVMDLWVDCAINDYEKKKPEKEWVTSKTATWH